MGSVIVVLLYVLIAALGICISYFVLKNAIKNGINESLLFSERQRYEDARAKDPSLPPWEESNQRIQSNGSSAFRTSLVPDAGQ
ncbi:hypothetical protein [Bifidobacterium primatium]|uniref:hypothetical protein n=1 Tax=Bifidobacterium primatium TaxID=2045438 RepID=UPI001056838B|nr:hypothetical protein [Bifidobacterium primatium]